MRVCMYANVNVCVYVYMHTWHINMDSSTEATLVVLGIFYGKCSQQAGHKLTTSVQ